MQACLLLLEAREQGRDAMRGHGWHRDKGETGFLVCALKWRTLKTFSHHLCVVFDTGACHELSYYKPVMRVL